MKPWLGVLLIAFWAREPTKPKRFARILYIAAGYTAIALAVPTELLGCSYPTTVVLVSGPTPDGGQAAGGGSAGAAAQGGHGGESSGGGGGQGGSGGQGGALPYWWRCDGRPLGSPCEVDGGQVCDGAEHCVECISAAYCPPGDWCAPDGSCQPP